MIVVVVPFPVVVTPPGLRFRVHVPVAGKPSNTTLAVCSEHVGWVIVPMSGAGGLALTVNIYVSFAATQAVPEGLSVVTVIVTVFPASPVLGVYVNVNGDLDDDAGLTDPSPFSEIATRSAIPPKVLPDTVMGVKLHVLPDVLPSVTVAPFAHPHDTSK